MIKINVTTKCHNKSCDKNSPNMVGIFNAMKSGNDYNKYE